MKKRKLWFGLAALVAALSFDYLFWGKSGGISFLVWTALLLVLGYVLAWREKKTPSVWSIVLTVLILGFAVISAWRSEGFTRFTSVVMVLSGLLLLATTFLNGHWLFYRIVDYIANGTKTIWAGVTRGFGLLVADENGTPALPGQKTGLHRAGSIFLGIAIAIPLVSLLGAILASADPVFNDLLQRVFSLDKLPEYLFRFTYIVVGAYVLIGVFLHSILPLNTAEKPDPQRSILSPFLGWTETSIVLGAVDLLFITFIVIQVRYLFGGQANITETGYTYSEYARRGFSELVAVAVISLALYLILHTITKRETKGAKVGFTALSVIMLANVLVILASSLQRLLLYESVYHFSELRTYTHIFIFWLAGLILATIVMQVVKRQGHFGLALLIMTVGFTATLGLMNVDGFVTHQNLQTAKVDSKLDDVYLSTLSNDAVPEMIRGYQDPTQPEKVRMLLGVQLACRTDRLKNFPAEPWQSLRFGELRAYNLLQANQADWSQYKVTKNKTGTSIVNTGGTDYSCMNYVLGD